MHKLIFLARCTKDAEMRYTDQGTAVTTVNLAINEGYGDNKKTIWIRGTLWAKLAENLTKYLVKGQEVMVVSTLTHVDGNPRVWGEGKSSFECRIEEINLVGGRPEAEQMELGTEEDIPF